MIDPSQLDPLTLALLSQRGGGPNVRSINVGGGSQLVLTPTQQSNLMMARSLMSPADRPMGRGAAIGNVIQNGIGAFMQAKTMRDAEEMQKGDAKTMADALRTWQGRPAEQGQYTDQETGDPVTINWNAQPGNKNAAMGMLASNPRLAPQAFSMQMQDEARRAELAQKSVTTLSAEEVAKMGLPRNTLVQRDAYGKLDVVSKPDGVTWLDGGAAPAPAGANGPTQTVPRDGAPQGTPGGPVAAPLLPVITKTAQETGLDPVTALTTAHIESGMGTQPDRGGSQYKGVFQLGDERWSQYGGTDQNRGDVNSQVGVGIKSLKGTQDELAQKLGRPPEPWETYLAHQQGVTGFLSLLNADPNLRASDAIAPYYKGGLNERAIAGNLPKGMGNGADTTAGQFLDIWRNRASDVAKLYGGQGRTQVADAGTVATDASPAGPARQPQRVGIYKDKFVEAGPDGLPRPYQGATNDEREYEAAKRGGFQGSFMDYQLALKRASKPETTIDMRLEGEEAKAEGKRLVEEFQGIQQRGQMAQDAITQISMARSIPEVDPQGNELPSVFQQKLGNAAVALGINVDTPQFKSILGNVSNGQAFTGVMQNLVLTKMQAQKGPQTENDAQRIESTVASLGNTTDARDFLQRAAASLAYRDVDQQAFYENWHQSKGTYRGASKAWREHVGGIPIIGIQPSTQKPVFFDEFRRGYQSKYPDQNEEQLLNAWRTSYAGR